MRFIQKIRMALDNLMERGSVIRPSGKPSISPNAQAIPILRKEGSGAHVVKFAGRSDRAPKEYSIDQFNLISGIQYIPGLVFQDEKTSNRIRSQCVRASMNGYIDEERIWLGALYLEQIRSNYIANVSIRYIDDTLGYGLFAEEDIKAWEWVGEYAGVVRKHRGIFESINDYCFLYPTSIFYYGKHIIDGYQKGNEIRYANHSDDPNCESISIYCDDLFHMILRAIKDIPANTQITYDYGTRYWKKRVRVPNI